MLQRILQRILQMCFHQITGNLIIAGTVGVVDAVMHLIDPVLGCALCFVKIGKNGELAAQLFCGVGQAAVLAVIIKEQMKTVGVLDPKRNIRFIELFFFRSAVFLQGQAQPRGRSVPDQARRRCRESPGGRDLP